jgi:hypothetical protein
VASCRKAPPASSGADASAGNAPFKCGFSPPPTEYALITSLSAVFLVGAPSALGANLNSTFAKVCATLK